MIQQLKNHSSSILEFNDGHGPVACVLLKPNRSELMCHFLKNEISEKELFEYTMLNAKYEVIYLCSALVLEECRRKGLAKGLVIKAIECALKNHAVKSVFVWPFSKEGDMAADTIARMVSLPLFKRSRKYKKDGEF